MASGYYAGTRPRTGNPPVTDVLRVRQGQVAVEPLRVAAPKPHVTTQSAPTQSVTVQPVAGHVTWHSELAPQSTAHDDAEEHSTWHSSFSAHWTSTGPWLPWMWHWLPPGVQSTVHPPVDGHTQLSPTQSPLPASQAVRARQVKTRRLASGFMSP